MKKLPRLHADDILLEVEEWMEVMRTSSPENFALLRSVINDPYHDICMDPDLNPILRYIQVTQEAYTAMNCVLPNTPETREYIAKGCTFVPVMLELIAIGYEIGKKAAESSRVKSDTPVTH